MHADEAKNIAARHDGVMPASWLTGPPDYQKAAVIAAWAWMQVKGADDPQLPKCDITHRTNCIGVVEGIMRGSEPDETPFAQAAYKIWLEVRDNDTITPPKEALAQ
jgi:hypothetical protein